ncbi:MAG TPA: hypothetical protein VN578_09460, partial [Candidatus Binatia bacterium]|nr:hypothetical protein [Candidatus Binatia bacterium]
MKLLTRLILNVKEMGNLELTPCGLGAGGRFSSEDFSALVPFPACIITWLKRNPAKPGARQTGFIFCPGVPSSTLVPMPRKAARCRRAKPEPKPGQWLKQSDFADIVRLTPLVSID